MSNPIVYIIKEQMIRGEIHPIPMDYSPAMVFGDIEFITHHDMPLYGKSQVQEFWNRDVANFAKKYDEQHDYIICTGQPMAILAVGYALGLEDKCPRFLVWRREENKYRIVNFDSEFSHASVP